MAGVVALGAVAALLAGCGAGVSASAAAPGNLGQLSGVVVDFFLPATGQQLTAGLGFFDSENALENAMALRCMAGRDFGPQTQPMVRYTELYINPLQGSPQVAGWQGENLSGMPNLYNLPALERGGLLAEVLTGSPNAPKVPAVEANAIYRTYTQCQNHAAAAFAKVGSYGAALAGTWLRAVSAVQASAQVRAAFSQFDACARKAGAPASAASSPDSFRDWLTNQVSPPMPDPYGRTAMISSEVRADHRWTAVFITCARPVIPLEDKLQLAAQKAFLDSHHQQVLALKQMASHLLSVLTRRYSIGKGN